MKELEKNHYSNTSQRLKSQWKARTWNHNILFRKQVPNVCKKLDIKNNAHTKYSRTASCQMTEVDTEDIRL